MLIWFWRWRVFLWTVAALLIGFVYAAPLAIIAAASFAGEWNGVLPSHVTFQNYANVLSGDPSEQLRTSLATAVIASAAALLSGTWAALALRRLPKTYRKILDMVFFIPSAVPSVSVGLGLLVAFSKWPILLNGTTMIVLVAHFVLISAFTYGNVTAGLARLEPQYEEVAACLGASAFYTLRKVTLPMILPYLITAFSLSFVLSMGELGATIMVYPPKWVTLPVGIFALTDRGEIFEGAALTLILMISALAGLILLSRIPVKAGSR